MIHRRLTIPACLFAAMISLPCLAAKPGGFTEPTHANVSYGPHTRNVLDFWQAKGKGPRPLVVRIHGGGWITGNKASGKPKKNDPYLPAGISIAAINYRLLGTAPLPAPVHDAARAIQFLRSKAKEWNINPDKIAVTGGSAGACTSMWLLLHDDLADKKAKDPILRYSTRVCAAAIGSGQTSIDPKTIKEWDLPKALGHRMIARAVGAGSMDAVWSNYKKYEKLYKEFSPVNHVDKNDPPLFMKYGKDGPADTVNKAIHHAKFGIRMKEASDKVGHECHLVYGGKQLGKYRHEQLFLKAILLKKK